MRKIGALQLFIVVAVVLNARAAYAQAEGPDAAPTPIATTAEPPVARDRVWFGYEILLVDAASLGAGLLIGAANNGDSDWQQRGDVIGSTWALGMIGALTIHQAHGNAALGLAGTATRLLLPPIGAVLGVASQCIAVGGDDPCSAAGGRGGFVVGMMGAMLLDSLAFARAEPDEPTAPHESKRVWYGYQTLVIDGAALAASLAFTVGRDHPDRSDDAARMLAFPYLVGFLVSPWVHAFHGRFGVAFGSLALRALAPALGTIPGIAGYCAASGTSTRCTKEGALWGLFGGTLLIAAIDIGTLSYERVSPDEAQTASIMPFVMPTNDGAIAGLAGRL